jgi:transposase-like protein
VTKACKEERNMLTMDKINDIRYRFYVKGENISQIAKAEGLDWKTVQKYIDNVDFQIKTNHFLKLFEPIQAVN